MRLARPAPRRRRRGRCERRRHGAGGGRAHCHGGMRADWTIRLHAASMNFREPNAVENRMMRDRPKIGRECVVVSGVVSKIKRDGQEQTGTTSSCTSTSYHLPVRASFGDGLSAATPCFGWVRGSIRCRAFVTTISFPIRVRCSQLGSQGRVLRYAAAPLAP